MPTIANAINPTLYPKLPYDPIKDFSYITNIAKVPGILCINPSLPINSVQDLIAYARSKPGKLSFSSAGNGSPHHLAGECLGVTEDAVLTFVEGERALVERAQQSRVGAHGRCQCLPAQIA